MFEKGIQTRQNRAGVIREIQNIKANKQSSRGEQLAILNVSQEDARELVPNKQKLNIFDEQDSTLLKHETLARLGFEDHALVAVDVDDQKSLRTSKSSVSSAGGRQKAIEYLAKANEQKESVREFISNSRKILTSQIAINDKTEETERLKEYIIMEREKLEEAKKTFEEDRDKFQKYMDDLTRKAEETALEVQKLTNEKNERISTQNNLLMDIQATRSEIKRLEEQLVVHKQRKRFLDTLAVSAGRKQENKVEEKRQRTESNKFTPGVAAKAKNFFMTQLPNGAKKIDAKVQEDEIQQAEESDQDFQIYFDKFTLLEHLAHLEEDNLFKIHLVQEDEQALEKLKKSIEGKINEKNKEIKDVNCNIEMLETSKGALLNKQLFLESNMRIK